MDQQKLIDLNLQIEALEYALSMIDLAWERIERDYVGNDLHEQRVIKIQRTDALQVMKIRLEAQRFQA